MNSKPWRAGPARVGKEAIGNAWSVGGIWDGKSAYAWRDRQVVRPSWKQPGVTELKKKAAQLAFTKWPLHPTKALVNRPHGKKYPLNERE